MHEKQVRYGRRGSGLSGSGRPFVSLLSRLASGLVFCCLVSTCIFLPWLLCSCVLLCRMLGLPWAFFGPLPGLSWDPFWASRGPFWGCWRPLASWASPRLLLGRSWASPWTPLGPSCGALGFILGCSWRLLVLSWAPSGPPVGPRRALLGALGPLLAAKDDFPRNL